MHIESMSKLTEWWSLSFKKICAENYSNSDYLNQNRGQNMRKNKLCVFIFGEMILHLVDFGINIYNKVLSEKFAVTKDSLFI